MTFYRIVTEPPEGPREEEYTRSRLADIRRSAKARIRQDPRTRVTIWKVDTRIWSTRWTWPELQWSLQEREIVFDWARLEERARRDRWLNHGLISGLWEQPLQPNRRLAEQRRVTLVFDDEVEQETPDTADTAEGI